MTLPAIGDLDALLLDLDDTILDDRSSIAHCWSAVHDLILAEDPRLAGYFDHIQVEGEFGLGKPERAVYLHVATSLGAAPERCLMVGDSFRSDVLGALDAGMHAAWIDVAGRGERLPATRSYATVATLVELAERLL